MHASTVKGKILTWPGLENELGWGHGSGGGLVGVLSLYAGDFSKDL